MRLTFFLILVSCIPGFWVQSQAFQSNSETTEIRVPSEDRLNEIANDERYNYLEEATEPSLWQRFRMWLSEKLRDWFSEAWVEWLLKIAAALAFIFVLVLLINQITKGELKNAFMRRQNRTLLDLRLNKNQQSASNFDELIHRAVENKKYGLAVRFLYQKALQLLHEGDLIQWKQDKTNHEYLIELGNHPAAEPFDRLTYFHDYVDYGDFQIDEPKFAVVQRVYSQFVDQLEVRE